MKPVCRDLRALLELRIHLAGAAQRDVKGRLQSVQAARCVCAPHQNVVTSRAGWARCGVYGCSGSDAQLRPFFLLRPSHPRLVGVLELNRVLCFTAAGMLGRWSFPAGSVLGSYS